MNRTALTLAVLAGCAVTASLVLADDDAGRERRNAYSSLDVAPVSNPAYTEECGSCHFAYQPGLLPQRSWQAIFSNLGDHFGDDASLDEATRAELQAYAESNAADHAAYKRSAKIDRSLGRNEIPLRITELGYFQRKHHEIPERMVSGNAKVGSFSRCEACHTEAASGSYNEHRVQIPGYGRWDD